MNEEILKKILEKLENIENILEIVFKDKLDEKYG